MPGFEDALTEDRHGTLIAIEVTAGARTSLFPSGYNEWRKTIGCRVSAPALEGRANKAVIAVIAETLDTSLSSVTISSGATSSLKKVLVTGMEKDTVAAILQQKI